MPVIHSQLVHLCDDYTKLTDGRRSVGYVDDGEDRYLCDRDLTAGWYRAVTGAGGDMPTTAPDFNHCGTLFPIWYNGECIGFCMGFFPPMAHLNVTMFIICFE